jgi:putative transposase
VGQPTRKILPHATPPWVDANAIFFVSVCCATREGNQLCRSPIAEVIFESVEFRHARHDWFMHLFLLMPDHLHFLVSFPRDRDMRKLIANWKEITAKKTRIHWQRDFFDHRLRAEESYKEKAEYIRMNPVRKGLISASQNWRFVWEPTA